MNVLELKERVWASVDLLADEIIRHARQLLAMPETGFREWKTHRYLVEAMCNVPFQSIERQPSIPGFKALLRGASSKSVMAVIADLDAVPEREVGGSVAHARHSCGHYAQSAHLLGCAKALSQSGVLSKLHGSVAFFACPAEEYVDLAWRYERMTDRTIMGISGKTHFWEIGWFRDVNAAISIHLADDCPTTHFFLPETCDGVCAFDIQWILPNPDSISFGRYENRKREWALRTWLQRLSSWTEIAQWNLQTTHSTERRKNMPLHRLTCLWTGKNPSLRVEEAIVSFGIDRSFDLDVRSYPVYEPLRTDDVLRRMVEDNAERLAGTGATSSIPYVRGATDLGNLSQKVPLIHPFAGGTSGCTHSADFRVVDEYAAYVLPVKLLCAVIIDWLAEKGKEGES